MSTPCGKCAYYDPILGPNEKDTGMAWCAQRSVYAHQEGPGQVFPPDVKRVGPGELAKPFIVLKGQVVERCEFMRPSHDDLVAKKRKAQQKADTKGRILV